MFNTTNMSQTDYNNFFHKLHCILRNGELGLTGMSALNEINNIILVVFMEPSLSKFKISNDFSFSNLYNNFVIPIKKHNNAKGTKSNIICDLIHKYVNILDHYTENENSKKYIYSDTNRLTAFYVIDNCDEEQLQKQVHFGTQLYDLLIETKKFLFGDNELNTKLIKDTINNINFDILGDAYEKFKEDDVGNSGKRTSQYFTPRPVIKYIVEELIKPKYSDLCYDSSCGTGGFPHYLDKFVKNKYNEKQLDKFKHNIYANDKNTELIKPLFINMFLHGIDITNIKNRNSLGLINVKETFEKFDVEVGNPPYSATDVSSINYSEYDNFMNTKYNYWPKFMKAGKNDVVKNLSGRFMIHILNSLKVGGKFGLVIDRGLLNNGTDGNSWEKKFRKLLLEMCNIHQIILLPKGIFKHTMFDTCIIYGTKKISFSDYHSNINNDISTKEIKYYVADFEDPKNNIGIIVPDEYLNLTCEMFINKDWSLNYDDYIEKIDNSINGIEYKTLGELIKNDNGGEVIDKKYFDKGELILYTCSNTIIYTNYDNFPNIKLTNKCDLLLPRNGSQIPYVKIPIEKSLYTNVVQRIELDGNINYKYVYYYLNLTVFDFFINEANSIPSYNMNLWKNRKIPILPQDHQQRIVDFIDNNIDNNNILDKLVSLFKDIDLFKFLIFEDYDTMSLAIEYAKDMYKYDTRGKEVYNIRRRCAFKLIDGEMKELRDIAKLSGGVKYKLSKQPGNTGHIIYLRGGDINDGYTDTFAGVYFDYKDTKFDSYRIYNGDLYYTLVGTVGICGEYKIDKETVISGNLCRIYDIKINKKYLVTYLFLNKPKAKTNAQPNISKHTASLIKIPVPSIEDQEKLVKMIEQIDNEENQFIKTMDYIKYTVETIYNKVEHTTDYNQSNNNQDDNEENEDESEEEESEDEPEYEFITYKDKQYIVENTIMYNIKKDKTGNVTKGKDVGTWIDGKFKKTKKEEVIED